jgi:PAS domain S-box-containing protein
VRRGNGGPDRRLRADGERQATQRRIARRPRETPGHSHVLFKDSPIPIWEADFRQLKTLIVGLSDSGILDLREYLETHGEPVTALPTMVKVIDANNATLELYGARNVEDFQDGLGAFFSEESRDTLKEGLIAIAGGKGSFDALAITRTLKGDRKRVRLRWSVAPGHDKTLSRVFIHVIDFTEYSRLWQALSESEERFRKLSEAASEGIAIHEKGRILDANRALATMFGYEPSEIVGMTAWDLTAPESRDLVSRRILAGYEQPYEIVGLRRDGSTFPIESCGKAIHHEGRVVRVAVMRDITERKRAEESIQRAREEMEIKLEPKAGRDPIYGLTFRELTVLYLVAAGKEDREIGVELGISHLTVQKHVAHILEKMDAHSRTEASVRAVRDGLLS